MINPAIRTRNDPRREPGICQGTPDILPEMFFYGDVLPDSGYSCKLS